MRNDWPTDLVTVDADSTLWDTRARQHMVDEWNAAGGGHDWDAYSLECLTDTPGPAFALVKALERAGHAWALVSARSEVARGRTWERLNRDGLHPRFLVLGDERWASQEVGHGQWKADAVARIMAEPVRLYDPLRPADAPFNRGAGHYRVVLHIDDRADVFAPMAAIGVPALIVRTPGEVEELGSALTAMSGDERIKRKIGL